MTAVFSNNVSVNGNNTGINYFIFQPIKWLEMT